MAIAVKSFVSKRIDEDVKVSWDFKDLLGSGETISTQVVTATAVNGLDATPANIISGAATVSGSVVTQLIVNGIEGETYLLQCEITTSDSQKLHGLGLLNITDRYAPA